MIETADLLDMERELDRRGFMRRLFAIGAGIAVGGALVRAVDAVSSHHWDYIAAEPDAFEGVVRFDSRVVCTQADWDKLLEEAYVKTQLVSAINAATPFKDSMRRKLKHRESGRYLQLTIG